jgi:hypothetical protein
MLSHQSEGAVELEQMNWTGMNDREPIPWLEHPRRLGEILRREDADYEVECRIVHRPVGPQIDHSKVKAWPASRRPTHCGSGNVEPKTDHRRAEVRRDACEVTACSGSGSEGCSGQSFCAGRGRR